MTRRGPTRTLVLMIALLAACDRPTAPEARAIARSFEQKFAEGDLRGVTQMFMSLGPAGFFWGSNYAHRNHALEIMRNGTRQRINGFVVEDVFIPPGGLGRPSTQRTLVGWPDDFGFAVYASAAGDAVAPLQAGSSALGHVDAMVIFRDTSEFRPGVMPDLSRNWMVRSGSMAIGSGVVTQGCGTAKEPLPYNHPDPIVTCDFASYPVDMRGEFTRVADSAAIVRTAQHLRIPQQIVPGVRFVTRCVEGDVAPSPSSMTAMQCDDAVQFWRGRDQYAPALGIDPAQFRRQGSGWYVRRIARSANDRPIAPRWSLYYPDGRLIERDSASAPGGTDRHWSMLNQLQATPQDRRLVALAPARHLVAGASRYDVVVLDMEFSVAP